MGMADTAVKGLDILCPAGRGVQCKDCGLCKGKQTRAKSIYVQGHGGKSVMRKMREFFAKQALLGKTGHFTVIGENHVAT
jgi:hypothetical protein